MTAPDLLRAILTSASSVAIIVTDRDGLLLHCNAGAQSLFGLSDAMPGMDCAAIFTPKDQAAGIPLQEMLAALAQGEITATRAHRQPGSAPDLWVESHVSPMFDRAGAHLGFMRIAQDVSERHRREQAAAREAGTDAVSGLSNRRAFDERFDEAVALSIRTNGSLALHLIDLDLFKQVNDTLGHSAGDEVLRVVAGRISSVTRDSDTVARFGGDEFAVLQTGAGSPVDAAVLADKLVAVLRQPIAVMGHEVHVTASIGIAVAPIDGWIAGELLRKADVALYRVKRSGRNHYGYFTHELDLESRNYSRDMAAVRQAVSEERFYLLYQPIIATDSGRVRSVEALLRCDHPALAGRPIPEVIDLIRKCGLITDMSRWIVRRACEDAIGCNETGVRHPVALNLCARELSDFHMVALIDAAMDLAGLAPDDISVELTEHALFESHDVGRGVLEAFSQRGLSIALDDFGTGYSSLSHLTTLPINVLKLDISFVRPLAYSPEMRTVVSAIITLAHTLGIAVVAEGVETVEQLDFLREQRCDAVQGYYFSHPLSAAEMCVYVNERRLS
ncbi:putative bifunctional diguanylate cyclase/phosphodiesterase [Telluria aromaticivorans]|uniref:EAL domain-containing protein n=1 Tax=Telluria aromaticivorans TaxID=2725995 RepID=A0A7Y2JYQ2_9BURK|nr:GGDEF and EAL domain-containing protein [Telluria aromaticivorans]NNG23475.1 EAL domain-containing protein [Telluria aromaticivorans]